MKNGKSTLTGKLRALIGAICRVVWGHPDLAMAVLIVWPKSGDDEYLVWGSEHGPIRPLAAAFAQRAEILGRSIQE